MKTYISIPISGRDLDEAQTEADMVKSWMQTLYVGEVAHEVITPFDVVPEPPDIQPSEQYAYCMGRDIEALLSCTQIVMCPGWQNSRGCRAEHEIAKIYGINIAYLQDIKQSHEETQIYKQAI